MMFMPHDFRFLVDANLPKYFNFFNEDFFFHVVDLNPSMTDNDIWDYAIRNNMVILTKDTDFYYRFLLDDVCPKVVFFKLGNMTFKTLQKNSFRYQRKTVNFANENYLLCLQNNI